MSVKKNLVLAGSAILIFLVGIIGGSFLLGQESAMNHNSEGAIGYSEGEDNAESNAESNKELVVKTDEGIKKLLAKGDYRCCLDKPCFYCFKKGECDCLDKIMNGKHPCGECIGEILEGEGNPLLAEYFATAIAEKVGEQYAPTLKQIIADKYDMPVERQL